MVVALYIILFQTTWTSLAPVIDIPYVEEEPVCLDNVTTTTDGNDAMTTTLSDVIETTLGSDLTTTGATSRASVCSWLYVIAFVFLLLVA